MLENEDSPLNEAISKVNKLEGELIKLESNVEAKMQEISALELEFEGIKT